MIVVFMNEDLHTLDWRLASQALPAGACVLGVFDHHVGGQELLDDDLSSDLRRRVEDVAAAARRDMQLWEGVYDDDDELNEDEKGGDHE